MPASFASSNPGRRLGIVVLVGATLALGVLFGIGFGKGLKHILSTPTASDCDELHPEDHYHKHLHLDVHLDSSWSSLEDGAATVSSSSSSSSAGHVGVDLAAVNRRHRLRKPPPPPPLPLPLLPHSATCGDEEVDFFIAVLAAPHARSARSRKLLRETWFKLKVPGTHVVIRFVFARNETGGINDELAVEADKFKDMVFVDTEETYRNLFNKVNLLFRWIVDNCKGKPMILKTDDDSFVRVDKLLKFVKAELPHERLYYGSFLKKMPARIRNKTTKILTDNPLPGNTQNMPEWPTYASGAGYIVSNDVARVIAYPPLPVNVQTAEDRGIGVQLFGMNISYIPSLSKLRPWGHCIPDALLLHYQRDPGLLRRRYERAVSNADICGEGWEDGHVCKLVDQYATLKFECPTGQTIESITWAGLGKHWIGTGYVGACEEGPSALEHNQQCFYNGTPTVKSIIEEACLGKAECEVLNDVRKQTKGRLAVADPCRGQYKRILAAARCS